MITSRKEAQAFVQEACNLLSFALGPHLKIAVAIEDKVSKTAWGEVHAQSGRGEEYEAADGGVRAFAQASLSALLETENKENQNG